MADNKQTEPPVEPTNTDTNPTANPKSEAGSATPPTKGKKTKRFSLPLPKLPFRRKKEAQDETNSEAETESSPTTSEPLEPDEVINLMDQHIKIKVEPDTVRLQRQMEETIDQTKDTHAVRVRINVVKTLLIVGALILLYPLYQIVPSVISSEQFAQLKSRIPFLASDQSEEETAVESQDDQSTATTSAQIRIRFEPDQIQTRDAIRALLVNSGFNEIDLIEDAELENGIELASKVDNSQLKEQLYQLLAPNYSVSSESAIVSTDSDFDAVILIGEQEL